MLARNAHLAMPVHLREAFNASSKMDSSRAGTGAGREYRKGKVHAQRCPFGCML